LIIKVRIDIDLTIKLKMKTESLLKICIWLAILCCIGHCNKILYEDSFVKITNQ